MDTPGSETYEVAPLLAEWRYRNQEHQRRDCPCTLGGECASMESLARKIGVSHSTMHRRVTAGEITSDEADQWACRVGVLPTDVWPHWGRVLREIEPDAVTP